MIILFVKYVAHNPFMLCKNSCPTDGMRLVTLHVFKMLKGIPLRGLVNKAHPANRYTNKSVCIQCI